MVDKFSKVQLGKVASVRSGFAFKSEDMGEYGAPIIKIRNIVPPTVDVEDVQRIPYEVVGNDPRIQQFALQEKDILIAMTGATVGKVGRMPKTNENYYLNQRVGKVSLTAPDRADYDFIYYVISQDISVGQIFSVADGSAQANISGNLIELLEIPLPPLPEQRAIAHILGTLDDKIELNRRMNQTLEALAQTLFKSWSVGFEPFCDKGMQDSPRGKIPLGWRTEPLDKVADFLNGLALQRYPAEGEDYLPVIKIAELRRGVTESSGRASPFISKQYIVEDGDILFSWSGSLEVCIWCGGKGALNQHLFKVTSAAYPRWFCYHWIKYHLPEFQAIAAGKATTMGHIQRYHLSNALVAIPPKDLLEKMDKKMSPILDRVINNNLESRTLAVMRDSLLPKLISGELRVEDAERFIGRVV